MITSGALVSAKRMNSKYGGHCYKCKVICEKGVERTLRVDRKMVNYKHWEQLVEMVNDPICEGKAILIGNLKVLKKNEERLDADVCPQIEGVCKISDLEPKEDTPWQEL